MKITRSQLKKLIKEELEASLAEFKRGDFGGGGGSSFKLAQEGRKSGKAAGLDDESEAAYPEKTPADRDSNAYYLGFVFGFVEGYILNRDPDDKVTTSATDNFIRVLFNNTNDFYAKEGLAPDHLFNNYFKNVEKNPRSLNSIIKFVRNNMYPPESISKFIKKYCLPLFQ